MADQEATPLEVPPAQAVPSFWQPTHLIRPPYHELGEPRSADQLWDLFNLLVAEPSRAQQASGTQRGEGSLNTPELLTQYRGFIRQAKSYWEAAEAVRDAAAALLYYYCFLNLAKAELLPFEQTAIEADPHHGLSMQPSKQDDVYEARITVKHKGERVAAPQVFELLYAKRTGKAWPSDVKDIAVIDALRRVPEIGFEMGQLGPDSVACHVYHAITLDDQFNSRSELLLIGAKHIVADPTASAKLRAMYEEAPRYPTWRNVFALSPRVGAIVSLRLRSRDSRDVRITPDSDRVRKDLGANYWLERIWRELDGIVEASGDTRMDGFLLPSLLNDKFLPLSTGLSRYIGFYYVSELVRYRPSALDPMTKPRQAWLLASFTRQASIPLLHDFYNHIAVREIIFQAVRP